MLQERMKVIQKREKSRGGHLTSKKAEEGVPSYLWMKATAAANVRWRPEKHQHRHRPVGHAKAVLSFYAAKVITTHGFLN